MKTRIALRPIIILVMLLGGIVITALSAFVFISLDQVVHGDLYRYGLLFNYQWAGQYWTYSRLMMSSLTVAVVVIGVLAMSTLVHVHMSKNDLPKSDSFLLLVVGIVMTLLSAFFFSRLNYVVQNDLYNYGLQFSYEWADRYWA